VRSWIALTTLKVAAMDYIDKLLKKVAAMDYIEKLLKVAAMVTLT
jgi:hypothetical protein